DQGDLEDVVWIALGEHRKLDGVVAAAAGCRWASGARARAVDGRLRLSVLRPQRLLSRRSVLVRRLSLGFELSRGGVMRTAWGIAAALLVCVAVGLGMGFAYSAHGRSAEGQARAVVGLFFESVNARRFEQTCDLLSARFYRLNHVPN